MTHRISSSPYLYLVLPDRVSLWQPVAAWAKAWIHPEFFCRLFVPTPIAGALSGWTFQPD